MPNSQADVAELRPFLKWAGGKRWLFDSGQFTPPCFSGRYIEPFLGGGAAFFSLRPHVAILGDANTRLIETYRVVRDDYSRLVELLREHQSLHCESYYYRMRGMEFGEDVARAAQFIYLNRTCWNGLYRENRTGQFNVPIGSKLSVLFESDVFEEWSRALRKAELIAGDFERVVDLSDAGDFLFVDPPYTVRHNMNGFVKYNQTIFAWEDQVRLRDALGRASLRGVQFAMTNADHESVKDLYCGLGSHQQIWRHSVIAGKASHRVRSSELLVVG